MAWHTAVSRPPYIIAWCIVCFHRPLVITPVLAHGTDAVYRITHLVELREDIYEIVCYNLITYKNTDVLFAILVKMWQMELTLCPVSMVRMYGKLLSTDGHSRRDHQYRQEYMAEQSGQGEKRGAIKRLLFLWHGDVKKRVIEISVNVKNLSFLA